MKLTEKDREALRRKGVRFAGDPEPAPPKKAYGQTTLLAAFWLSKPRYFRGLPAFAKANGANYNTLRGAIGRLREGQMKHALLGTITGFGPVHEPQAQVTKPERPEGRCMARARRFLAEYGDNPKRGARSEFCRKNKIAFGGRWWTCVSELLRQKKAA